MLLPLHAYVTLPVAIVCSNSMFSRQVCSVTVRPALSGDRRIIRYRLSSQYRFSRSLARYSYQVGAWGLEQYAASFEARVRLLEQVASCLDPPLCSVMLGRRYDRTPIAAHRTKATQQRHRSLNEHPNAGEI